MAGYAISLVLPDGQSKWKVITIPDSKPKEITIAQAEQLARVFGDVVGLDGNPTPFEIVRDGSTEARARLRSDLVKAESEATRVPSLRKELADIGEQVV